MRFWERYTLLHSIGDSGGNVYLALDHVSHQKRVLKVLDRSSFRREFQILQKIQNPACPILIDAAEESHRGMLVLEFRTGETLEMLLKKDGAMPEEEILRIGKKLCGILEWLHGMQPAILHLDLKPSNILIDPAGEVMLLDFGSAVELRIGGTDGRNSTGTPGYAAPEQYENGKPDIRTDLFQLGMVLNRMMKGYHPGMGRKYSKGLKRIIRKAVRTQKKARYQNAAEFCMDLEGVMERPEKKQHFKQVVSLMVLVGICLYSICTFIPGKVPASGLLPGGAGMAIRIVMTGIPERILYAELEEAGADFTYPADKLENLLWKVELDVNERLKNRENILSCVQDYRKLVHIYAIREAELGEVAGIRIAEIARTCLGFLQQSGMHKEESFFLECLIVIYEKMDTEESRQLAQSFRQRYEEVQNENI